MTCTHDDSSWCTAQCDVPTALERQTELDERNERNLNRWQCQRAWLDHLDPYERRFERDYCEPRCDVRNAELKQRWNQRIATRIVARGHGWITFLTTTLGRHEYRDCPILGRPTINVGEIDLGDVVLDWCEPSDPRERQRRGLSLGIGDAPGSARIVCGYEDRWNN